MIVACECAGLDQRCDLVTGECTCPATTQGHICDKCVQDYWDWTPRGCKVRSTKCNSGYPSQLLNQPSIYQRSPTSHHTYFTVIPPAHTVHPFYFYTKELCYPAIIKMTLSVCNRTIRSVDKLNLNRISEKCAYHST